jgi:hypothetical protein
MYSHRARGHGGTVLDASFMPRMFGSAPVVVVGNVVVAIGRMRAS